jgi:ubiquinone/menaquinone biosynthesis C-methylase UbiE
MFEDSNQKTYTARSLVQHYAQLRALQPAEKTVLALLRGRLSSRKMLDLGVGGGRTTQHFAPLVAEYVGLDYSPEMIAACQKRFAPSSGKLLFEVGDARDLSRFRDNYFDFILFSFNGIDSISHSDRLRVWQEISRVGKSGGYFCFSSHNLQGMEREFEWRNKLSLNPFASYVNLVMWAILRWCNPSINLEKLKVSDYAIVRDEPHNFRLQTYYIRPQEQLKQLESNFRDIKIYSWKSGREISSKSELLSNTDMWLYYLGIIR